MKILHTADWHLGQRFYDRERFEEHERFLAFLLETIERENIELLIVAGDVFDTANPPREAERIYFDFLRRLRKTSRCKALILGGNHDSAPHLDAPRRLLSALDVQVLGAVPADRGEALLHVEADGDGDPGVWIAALPYLRDRDVRRAVAGEDFADLEARTRAGVVACYREVGELLAERRQDHAPAIATGHLTAVGSHLSEGERTIHIGNLGSISAAEFPEIFDYVALGHLHRAQAVGGLEHIRYAGSPIPLSFSEAGSLKELRLIDTRGETLTHRGCEVPEFRRLRRVRGDVETVRMEIETLEVKDDELTPWLELVITAGEVPATLNDELRELAAGRGAEVLKVGLEAPRRALADAGLDGVSICELNPRDVFARKLEGYEGDVPPEVLEQCFQSLLTREEEA